MKKKYCYSGRTFRVSINLSDTERTDYRFVLIAGEYRILKISFANWNPQDVISTNETSVLQYKTLMVMQGTQENVPIGKP